MDSEMKKVEGHETLYKNEDTGLVVNTDKGKTDSLREQYRLARRHALSNIETRDDLKDLAKDVEELKELKEEMKDIKSLLLQLVNKDPS